MLIVDTHCHASLQWYEPVESLLGQMDRNDVQYAVLVQIHGEYNNAYQFECVERFPKRLISVVGIDATSPETPAELARLKERGARGVRLRVPATPREVRAWHAAAELRLPVSCSGTPETFAAKEFAVLVERVPELPIVIEHLGGLTGREVGTPDAHQVLDLARFPNTYMKIHGLGEFATRAIPVKTPFPFVEPIPPILDQVYEAFGAARMLWGSDYPPVSGREGYTNALKLTMAQFSSQTDEERALIFRGTAARLYHLR